MIVYSDEQSSEKLKRNPELDVQKTDKLIASLFPNEKLEKIDNGNLSFTSPPDAVIYAGCFEGISVIAAKEFCIDYPSQLDTRFIEKAGTRNIYLHAMHSVVDWFAFAKWEDGHLIRSLSLSPDSGILEDIGEKLPFEAPFWQGAHSVADPEDEDDDYPFKFHPLELGEEALRSCFGYQLEGFFDKSLIDPENISLLGYKRTKSWWKFW